MVSDACELVMDPETAHRHLSLSDDNRKVTAVRQQESYPDHPQRFTHWRQLLCKDGLTGRCYWEVERKGDVHIAVTYKGIRKRGDSKLCFLGGNSLSWSLKCSDDGYSAIHNNKEIRVRPPFPLSNRLAVYLDCPAGTLSFYGFSSGALVHLHTFYATFTEPAYPAFGFRSGDMFGCFGASVSLCEL